MINYFPPSPIPFPLERSVLPPFPSLYSSDPKIRMFPKYDVKAYIHQTSREPLPLSLYTPRSLCWADLKKDILHQSRHFLSLDGQRPATILSIPTYDDQEIIPMETPLNVQVIPTDRVQKLPIFSRPEDQMEEPIQENVADQAPAARDEEEEDDDDHDDDDKNDKDYEEEEGEDESESIQIPTAPRSLRDRRRFLSSIRGKYTQKECVYNVFHEMGEKLPARGINAPFIYTYLSTHDRFINADDIIRDQKPFREYTWILCRPFVPKDQIKRQICRCLNELGNERRIVRVSASKGHWRLPSS